MELIIRAVRSFWVWIYFAILFGCTFNREKHPTVSSSPKINIALHSYYQCPNHPEIKQYNPGYCSICHSDLEKPGALAMNKDQVFITRKSEKKIVVHVNERIFVESENVPDSLQSTLALLTWKDQHMYMSLAGHQYKIEENIPVLNSAKSKNWILIEKLEFNHNQKITTVTISKKGIWIPKAYLVIENGDYYVLKLEQGNLIKTLVTLGYSSEEYVEVLDLEQGAQLQLPF